MSSFLIISVIAILILVPFYGSEIMKIVIEPDMLENSTTIGLLKYLQIVNQIALFVIPSLIFAWLYNRNVNHYFNPNKKISVKKLFVCLLLLFISIPAISALVEWNEAIRLPEFMGGIENWMRNNEDQANKITEVFLNTSSIEGFVVNLIMIAVLAAIAEELFFRGILVNLLLDLKNNIHLAVWISAILFSSLHLQFFGFFPRLILGVIFGYIYVAAGNIWYPILLHFIFNGMTVVAAYLYNTGHITSSAENLGSYDSNLIIGASAVFTIILMIIILRSTPVSPIKKD